jgi:HSP20 family protein
MAETPTKLPVKTDPGKHEAIWKPTDWRPFEMLQGEINRLFDNFGGFRTPFHGFNIEPFWARETKVALPDVDIVEKDKAFEITADLPGMDEKNVEVQLSNGNLTIKGEKKEEKEEKKKGFYLQERRFGSFERTFGVPEAVEADKIEANFKNGVLTITLPKKPEARKPAKKIDVKAA